MDRRTALNKERLWHAFKHFNPTGDGRIDKEDLLQVFRRKGENIDEDEVKEMLEELDETGQEETTHNSAPIKAKSMMVVVEEEKPGATESVPLSKLSFSEKNSE